MSMAQLSITSRDQRPKADEGKPTGGPKVKQFTRTKGAEIREGTVIKCDPGWYVVRLVFGVEWCAPARGDDGA
jgi:hypothetical protein